MQHHNRDSWADAAFWGVTLTTLLLLTGVPIAVAITVLAG